MPKIIVFCNKEFYNDQLIILNDESSYDRSKVEQFEFLDRLKAAALKLNKLTVTQKMILKHWIGNTIDENMAENAIKILDTNKFK